MNEIKRFLPTLPQFSSAVQGAYSRFFLGLFKPSGIEPPVPAARVALQMIEGDYLLTCVRSSLVAAGRSPLPFSHRLVVHLMPPVLAVSVALFEKASPKIQLALCKIQNSLIPMYRTGYAVACIALIYFGGTYFGVSALLALGADLLDESNPILPYFGHACSGGFIIAAVLNNQVWNVLIFSSILAYRKFFASSSAPEETLLPPSEALTPELLQKLRCITFKSKPEALARLPKPVIPDIELATVQTAQVLEAAKDSLNKLISSLETREGLPLQTQKYRGFMRDYLKIIAHYAQEKNDPSVLLALAKELYQPKDKDFPDAGNFQAIEEVYRKLRSDLPNLDLRSKILFHLENVRRTRFIEVALTQMRKNLDGLLARVLLGSYRKSADFEQTFVQSCTVMYGLDSPSAENNEWTIPPWKSSEEQEELLKEFSDISNIENQIENSPISFEEIENWWKDWIERQSALSDPEKQEWIVNLKQDRSISGIPLCLLHKLNPILIRAMLLDMGILEVSSQPIPEGATDEPFSDDSSSDASRGPERVSSPEDETLKRQMEAYQAMVGQAAFAELQATANWPPIGSGLGDPSGSF